MWLIKNNQLLLDGYLVADHIWDVPPAVIDKMVNDLNKAEEELAEAKFLLQKREELLTRLLEKAGKD